MARPLWSGSIQISLVSFGVGLIPATNPTSEIAFHQIDRKTGQRIRHQKVVNDDHVEASSIVKGYEISKGKYIAVEPEEISKLRIASRTILKIERFVYLKEIPPAYFERPYFVVPESSDQTAAYAVICQALEQTGKAGLGEIAFAGREHLVVIAAAASKGSRGLMAYTMRYAQELRKAEEYFPSVSRTVADKKQLAMAVDLIDQYTDKLDLSAFKDDYEVALRELIDAKVKNKPLPIESAKQPRAKVINLADALRQSLSEVQKHNSAPASRTKARTAKKGPQPVKLIGRSHRAA